MEGTDTMHNYGLEEMLKYAMSETAYKILIWGACEKSDYVLNFFKDVKNNIKFLSPIVIGIGIVIILFGNLLRFLFNNFTARYNVLFYRNKYRRNSHFN